jgi:hypothetical protein
VRRTPDDFRKLDLWLRNHPRLAWALAVGIALGILIASVGLERLIAR